MYINLNQNGSDFEELKSEDFSIASKSDYMDNTNNKYIKIHKGEMKTANHIACRIAKHSEAFIPTVRILIDIKEDNTFEYLKEKITEQ